MLTKDLSDVFFERLSIIAARLQSTALDMLSVMYSESGCMAAAHNPNGDASGLIQFMPDTLVRLGWSKGHAAFRKLNAIDQLPFVEQYYKPYVGNLDTVAGLYVATFLPALISHCHDPKFVLTAKNGPLGWAYAPNASFDANHDLAITVGELEIAVHRNCQGSRWEEIKARESGEGLEEAHVDIDLGTIYGLQEALDQLGFDPGPIDGIAGPKTHAAIREFQAHEGLKVDGIYGPLTKKALSDELE